MQLCSMQRCTRVDYVLSAYIYIYLFTILIQFSEIEKLGMPDVLHSYQAGQEGTLRVPSLLQYFKLLAFTKPTAQLTIAAIHRLMRWFNAYILPTLSYPDVMLTLQMVRNARQQLRTPGPVLILIIQLCTPTTSYCIGPESAKFE